METLDKRIAKALAEPAEIGEVQDILDAARSEWQRLEALADAHEAEALSPAIDMAEAQQRRGFAAERRFEADRLDAACSALQSRVVELREAMETEARAKLQEEARHERDTLARDLAERYPALVRELTILVHRIHESNNRCKAAGIPATAEQQGRGLPENFYSLSIGGTCSPISSTFLPMPSEARPAWESYGIDGGMEWRGFYA